jgi:hypothetical protein
MCDNDFATVICNCSTRPGYDTLAPKKIVRSQIDGKKMVFSTHLCKNHFASCPLNGKDYHQTPSCVDINELIIACI